MAAQGERGHEGLEIDLELNESMAQDESTAMQVELSPQINTESEMGAAAGAADERPPRANLPTDRMMDIFEALMGKMDANMRDIQAMGNKMDAMKENIN